MIRTSPPTPLSTHASTRLRIPRLSPSQRTRARPPEGYQTARQTPVDIAPARLSSRAAADGSAETVAGTSLLRFDADGRVVEQRDAWAGEPGAHELPHWAANRP